MKAFIGVEGINNQMVKKLRAMSKYRVVKSVIMLPDALEHRPHFRFDFGFLEVGNFLVFFLHFWTLPSTKVFMGTEQKKVNSSKFFHRTKME